MSGAKECYPRCRDFNCTKRAMSFRGKTTWCTWAEEECNPKGCIYATCYKRQLLENGICGLTIKRKTQESISPEDFMKDEIRAKGKLARKLGDRSIF
ncbi:hypothetical protein JW865_01895 [Candidatus Bathyarchaeota archaeon]|nr:hypothetical protein [Candidatus Bathyarchaeota archaeon]